MIDTYYAAEQIKPIAIYTFIDKLQVWLKQPASLAQLRCLKAQCGEGGLHVKNEQARFNGSYRQRLQLNQPSTEALEWLAGRNDVLLSSVEFAMDWIFADKTSADDAFDLVRRYHVKKHHRRQSVKYAGRAKATRYTGPRRAPNVMVTYADRPSKATGEVHCVHLEWRTKGTRTLRRAGIESAADLISGSWRMFWFHRLLLYDVVPETLGRLYDNHFRRAYRSRPRRTPWVMRYRNGFTYDVDRRVGCMIIRACGSTQAVLDAYGSKLKVREQCLFSLSSTHLLPD